MSVKGWFAKKMMAAMREVNEAEHNVPRVATEMERMFGNCSPSIIAFRIENGFVVRTVSTQEAYEGRVAGGFTYCKDHTEIAEHIVASEVKRKLVGEQQEMFGQSIPAMLQKQAVVGSGGYSTKRI